MEEYRWFTAEEFFGEVNSKPESSPVVSPKKECDEPRFMATKKRLAERVCKLKVSARVLSAVRR